MASPGVEHDTGDRVANHGEGWASLVDIGDGGGEAGHPPGEVVGAVDRVEHPVAPAGAAGGARFLAVDAVLRDVAA